MAIVNLHFLQDDGQGGIPKKRRIVSIVVVTSTTVSAFCSLQEIDPKSRLFSKCPDGHFEEHLPFKYDVSKTKDFNSLKTLCQDGYVILYSTRRKTPLFTAERLDGPAFKKAMPVRKFITFVYCNEVMCNSGNQIKEKIQK